MRFRLLKRRLTISAPSMAIRSNMAWPLRWAIAAVMLGFSAAIALWAFEFGKDLAGLDKDEKEQLAKLQVEVVKLKDERDKAQTVANTSGGLLATEKATQEKLAQTVKQLETENRALREDLSFFERLIPSTGKEALAIRGLQAQMQPAGDKEQQLKWQVLILQAEKTTGEFKGKLELTASGFLNGKAWSANLPEGTLAFEVKQYRRMEGLLSVPVGAQVKTVMVKVLDNSQSPVVKATQSIKL